MKDNAILKIGIPIAVLLVGIFIFSIRGGDKPGQVAQENYLGISPEEAKLLGVEGDTAKDTLATLIGQYRAVRVDIEAVTKQNEELLKENERLRQREANIDSRIDRAVKTATDKTLEEAEKVRIGAEETTIKAQGLIGELQSKFGALGSDGAEDIPIGLGLEAGDGEPFTGGSFASSFKIPFGNNAAGNRASGTSVSDYLTPSGSLLWVEPLDGLAFDPKTNKPVTSSVSFPNDFTNTALMPFNEVDKSQKELRAKLKGEQDLDKNLKRGEDTKPYYTIAENSTLMGSQVMTALIGRVPIDGSVNDPYPFKVLLGKDNLAANGIDLPEVAHAVMSGVATGDWTLSCVRGQVESITFIFEDGTIRTVPEPEETLRRGQSMNTSTSLNNIRGGIGYISDPHGIPCVSGERKSNAKQYLSTQSLITAAGAGVASLLAEDDNSNYTGTGTVISDRNQALNTILTGGVNDVRSWVNRLYGQAFAAVYVPPHADIAVHIDREIRIDYEPHGRKVNYHADASNTYDLP